jgi:hypothetical protein
VQPVVELAGREEAAFVEQFRNGSEVGGGDGIAGTCYQLAVVGTSRFGRGIRTI